jgi:hypothetical protein
MKLDNDTLNLYTVHRFRVTRFRSATFALHSGNTAWSFGDRPREEQ